MRTALVILIIPILTAFTSKPGSYLEGVYCSVNNKFERWSTIELSANKKFVYYYCMGGCQGEITGSYEVIENRIHFKNDKEFMEEYQKPIGNTLSVNDSLIIEIDLPVYPDLSLVKWKINQRSIKPIAVIDMGCLEENGKHKRMKNGQMIYNQMTK